MAPDSSSTTGAGLPQVLLAWLDGSVRAVVLFDRVLMPEEVTRLVEATRPAVQPPRHPENAVIVDGRKIPLASLARLRGEDLRDGLEQVEQRDVEDIRRDWETLLPILTVALDDWPTRRVAASLLVKVDRSPARALMQRAMPRMMLILRDAEAPLPQRLSSALGLAEMGGLAMDAEPVLVWALETLLRQQGVHLPRIDDVLRNALISALLAVGAQSDQARQVLAVALAKPVLDSVDLSRPYLTTVRSLFQQRRYLEALEVYRGLPLHQRDRFFSQGDIHRDRRQGVHERSYTTMTERDGVVYQLGEGVAYSGVERISTPDHERAVEQLAAEYPAASAWRRADAAHLYRARITKTAAAGVEQAALLEGDWFIFDGEDEKVRGWSIAVDKEGYLHVIGGQHNRPNPDSYIPGSWEKMGLSRDWDSHRFPAVMYWVSREPGDIRSFEFVGRRGAGRLGSIPDYLNYMNFVQDRNGELFLYGRINVSGIQSWGLYHYDAQARQWAALGGHASTVIESARETNPGWTDYLVRQVRGEVPTTAGPTVLVWAWQPHFYNYCRANRWGVQFDRTNRMHVRVPIRGLDERARITDAEVYAYSDDGGATFHRADGTKQPLPLTVNPGPGNADVRFHFTDRWWNLWLSVLEQAGFVVSD